MIPINLWGDADLREIKDIIILVVDDEPELREIITIEFEMLGFHVLEANTANEALELIKKTPADVLISDVIMPGGGGTGIELLDRIEELGLPKPITFLMTGFADLLDEEVGYEKRIEAVFQKPFSRMELVEAVLAKLEPIIGQKIKVRNRSAA